MNRGFKDDNRRVLPTWRDFNTTMNLGELGLGKRIPQKPIDTRFLENALSEWGKNKELSYAAELVSAAIIANNYPIAIDAAKYIVKNASGLSDVLISMCKRVLETENNSSDNVDQNSINDKSQFYNNIRNLRVLLLQNPKNSIAWIDIARNHIILGNADKAYDAVKIALQLSPENRFVLRSTARFLLHIGEVSKAYEILRKSELINSDPWVLASEISIANLLNKTSNHIKIAREVTNSKRFSPFDTSELSSALGTLEFGAGNTKLSKKLFSLSLEDPNDNALAQVVWISKWLSHPKLEQESSQFRVPCSFEANAISFYFKADWKNTMREIELWILDQPFSSRPAIFGSYIASTCLEDYEKSESLLKNTMVSNPDENLIINNLAFALINQGKISEAEKILSQFNNLSGTNEQIIWNATHGLLLFRKGLVAQGRESYLKAISMASKPGFEDNKAMAALYLANEEIRSHTPEAERAFSVAENLAKKSNDVVVSCLYDKTRELLDRSKDEITDV